MLAVSLRPGMRFGGGREEGGGGGGGGGAEAWTCIIERDNDFILWVLARFYRKPLHFIKPESLMAFSV